MTISHSGSVWKGTSERCSLISSADTRPHPTLQHMDPLLYQIQQTPSNLGQLIGGKGDLDLEWKYENKGYPVTQIMNSKAVIYKSLKVVIAKRKQITFIIMKFRLSLILIRKFISYTISG